MTQKYFFIHSTEKKKKTQRISLVDRNEKKEQISQGNFSLSSSNPLDFEGRKVPTSGD